jgi:fucose 4-O-acetylase-like acetyltransferase
LLRRPHESEAGTIGNMTRSSTDFRDTTHESAAAETNAARPAAPALATRLQWVDQAKGIGIVLVVYGHVIDGVRLAGISIDPAVFRWTWDTLYSFHIPLFFFLSGLFFPQSWQRRGVRGVMLNKVDTLVYPYVLWSLLQGFIQVAMSQHINNPVTSGEVLSLLWHPRQEFWFLYALFFTYLFACILYFLVPPAWRRALLLGAVVLYVFRSSVSHVPAIWYPTWYLLYFLAGALLHTATRFVTERTAITLPLAALVFAAATVVAHQLAQTVAHGDSVLLISASNIVSAVSGIALSIALAAVLARHGWSFMAFVGRMSLQIYLLHTLAAAFTRVLLLKGLGVHNLQVHLVLGTTVGVGVPLLFAYLLERWRIPGFFAPPPRLQLQPGAAA